jgi:tRNA (guanosine-2'-O-)-methyltransferase
MNPADKIDLIEYLRSFKLENRLMVFDTVMDMRTRYFTVVMENIKHSHNINAVLRSCECFGIQDLYLINDHTPFNLHKKIAKGSFKWLTLNKYEIECEQNSTKALADLKSKGYRIVATTPDPKAISIHDLDITSSPLAFVFGTELTGISSTIEQQADVFVTIPTVGFTQSLNISVSAALVLQIITDRIRKSQVNWALTEDAKNDLMLEWLRKSIPKVDLIENRFWSLQKLKIG